MLPSLSRGVLRRTPAGTCVRLLSSGQTLADIDPAKLSVQRTTKPKEKLPKEKLQFGKTFTDHMLDIDWDVKSGWKAPRIIPYQPLALDPAATALHYALQCFEGMKAYLDETGRIRLFRPELNMQRMNDSMRRLNMPTFSSEGLLECIKQLVKVDKDWIPRGDGYSLYIRPTGIATHPFLGVGPAHNVKLYTILSPVGPYYPEGFAPVKLYASREYVRAWPGGTGGSKVGANYGPTIMPQMEVAKRGYTQVLWLFGPEANVTEVGTMNVFVLWTNEQGEKELVTPSLDGTILPGVTRQSVLDLARQWREFRVSERTFSMFELQRAVKQGRVHEMFGCGTAAVVSPIKSIHFDGEDLSIPIQEKLQAGELTKRLWDTITGIQSGRIASDWSMLVD